jgi:hypothetical protein
MRTRDARLFKKLVSLIGDRWKAFEGGGSTE